MSGGRHRGGRAVVRTHVGTDRVERRDRRAWLIEKREKEVAKEKMG